MRCTFMHKNTRVLSMELDSTTGLIRKTGVLYSAAHLPPGIPVRHGTADRGLLNEWWTDRSIPASRSGIREALETMGLANTGALLVRCYGLSLSDQYWICPEDSGLTWDKINFFDHEFSDDIGDILFGAEKKADRLDFSSPDNTSDGNLKKRWKIIDGTRCLIKGGSNPFRQQPFNEVIASEIMARLDIPHIPYTVTWSKGAPYSVCENFVTRDTELIPAWRILRTQKKNNSVSVYQHFINCCETLSITDPVPFLDRMLTVDYIIANEDRHFNNFGVLRDAETLQWLGFAPIYDSGSSLGYDKMPAQIRSGKEVICKPFKKHHEEQLLLVSDFSWIDFDRLTDVPDLITDILSADGADEYVGKDRISAISDSVARRIQKLAAMSSGAAPAQSGQDPASTSDDVETNIAAKYN